MMNNELLDNWLSLSHIQMKINNKLEIAFQDKHNITLKEFYVLYHLLLADDKKLRLQDLPDLVGLSQSAVSRLVTRLEAKNCKGLERDVCEGDRRGVYTRLSARGEEEVRKCIDTFHQIYVSAASEQNIKQELQILIKKI
ncbi:MarR family transcriptional regulator [Paenibacillus sp. BIHB 4019]|uniref:MarR family transcriptional regulator n=2 Tax=Paenibacillus sp. BIHB 4019 TaxID=1870819 RepID=A0A1B2DQR4_9BACL|nr:MarR family transcriptional regulator [Paenibacillus sp. BIHB 4019]